MRLRALFVGYGVPSILLIVGMALTLANRDSIPAVVLLAAVALTSPVWAFVALRIDQTIDDRPELLDAVDFQLTMLTGYVVGAVLLLFFVGLFVMLAVIAYQAVIGAEVVWRALGGEAIRETPKLRFSRRLRPTQR